MSAEDSYHDRCMATAALIRDGLLTVWPALAEAMHFAERYEAQDMLWDLFEKRAFSIAELDAEDCTRMRYLMRKYRDLPMDLADAALVTLAERERINKIFTLDRRDFSIYKPAGMKRFEIIP